MSNPAQTLQQLIQMLQPPSSSPGRTRSRSPRPRHNRPDRVQQAIDRTRQTAIAAAQEVVQQASLINAEVLKSLLYRLEKIDEKLSAIGNALQMLTDKMDPPGDNDYENMEGLLEDARVVPMQICS
ncbi:hypothetical protein AAVH_35693 [Aphelenchoides avenae]|nr:hypothetical protein AAVH_35693 [Aphelenchus avenae]